MSSLPNDLGHIPMSPTIDFAELIKGARLPGVFDPNSVEVVDLKNGRIVPHARTEDFAYSDRGRIEWVIKDSAHTELRYDSGLRRDVRRCYHRVMSR